MEKSKLIKTAEELREESFNRGFKVKFNPVGTSMWPLLDSGDILFAIKVRQEEIRTGDIVICQISKDSSANPLVHRVVKKITDNNGVYFRTKGDFNSEMDNDLVSHEHVVGRVTYIKKKKYDINLETAAGNVISMLSRFASKIMRLYKKMEKIFCEFYPESGAGYSKLDISLRSNMGITAEEWMKCVECMDSQLRNIPKENDIADVQISHGFSEEALKLLRKGVKVRALELLTEDNSAGKFDCIIFARSINALDSEKQAQILRTLNDNLKPGGKILLSWINFKENKMTTYKRKIWSILLGGHYKGVPYNAVSAGTDIVKWNLDRNSIRKAALVNGLKILNLVKSGDIFCATLTR